MNTCTYTIPFGCASVKNDFGAEYSLKIPWGNLPESHQEVTITLFVDHDFADTCPVQLCLQIIARKATGSEDSSSEDTDCKTDIFSYYPASNTPIPLTLEDMQNDNLDKILNKVNSTLLEQFVNNTVHATFCTLECNNETGLLTAQLRWNHSRELIVETKFYR